VTHFRDFLFPLDHPRLAGLADHDATSFADSLHDHPILKSVLADWTELFETTTFQGITTDGAVVPDLFALGGDEGAPTAAAVAAAEALGEHLGDRRGLLFQQLNSKVWRAWMNPEIYLNRFGLRLEEEDDDTVELVHGLMAASLSESGYQAVVAVMKTNEFLGTLVGLPRLLNEGSYNINVFGTPSTTEPWGWNLYGHHVCLNTLFIGGQQVFTPVFIGAEPIEIDDGPDSGVHLFRGHDTLARELVASMTPAQAAEAIIYHHKRDPSMPEGRLHPGDELHLGGAFQDNRVIPFEGTRVADFSALQRQKLLAVAEEFLHYQPDGPKRARLEAIASHLDDTWFCWIGGTSPDSVFYLRIQSPVIMIEFDHHAGIFLANTEPERFHVHTLVRTPNGNDYGAALVKTALGSPQLLDQ